MAGDSGTEIEGTTETKTADDSAAKLSEIAKENAALKARLAKYDEDKKSAEKARKDKERLDAEGASKLLDEKTRELDTQSARLKKFEERETARTEKLLEHLPDELREHVEGLREKMDLADWVALVEAQVTTIGKVVKREDGSDDDDGEDGDELRPSFINGGSRAQGAGGAHKPCAKSLKIADKLGIDPKMFERLDVVRDRESGASKFTRPVRKFFADMPRVVASRLTFTSAKGRG